VINQIVDPAGLLELLRPQQIVFAFKPTGLHNGNSLRKISWLAATPAAPDAMEVILVRHGVGFVLLELSLVTTIMIITGVPHMPFKIAIIMSLVNMFLALHFQVSQHLLAPNNAIKKPPLIQPPMLQINVTSKLNTVLQTMSPKFKLKL